MAKRTKRKAVRTTRANPKTASYSHPDATTLLRPEVGTQPQFRKKKPPAEYRYDSSLSPALEWDGQNWARELGAWLIARIDDASRLPAPHEFPEPQHFKNVRGEVVATVRSLADAVEQLKRLERPFLNWAGKAERLSFEVPTLPLFVHERLSTKAILETLKAHKRDKQMTMFELFGDPQHSVADQVLKAYEHQDEWRNRMILGDSLVVMNSLLRYEGLGGQVQMIYMDPPYGIEYGSNFQPFVRRRNVRHNDDEDMTREPEMVRAYRDTWELGLHSYLTYMRDRLLLSRDLLHTSGSLFVQISGENLHLVTDLLDEVFGPDNLVSIVPFRKKTMPLGAKHLESICDYLIWYARSKEHMRFNRLYREFDAQGDPHWNYVELSDGSRRRMSKEEINNHRLLPKGAIPFQLMSLYPVGVNQTGLFEVKFRGRTYFPPEGNSWFTNPGGMKKLIEANRIEPYEDGDTLRYVLKLTDGQVSQLTNMWADTSAPRDKSYVVQTNNLVVQRCMLMTTNPGDLVLDPTCGSGTTAYVAEQWGRRWITIDTSRVPLALARQRMLTATFPYYRLADENRGPASGLVYEFKTNTRGEQKGGIIRAITRGTVANDEPPNEFVLVDQPECESPTRVTRVTGPFVVEATIPAPIDWDNDGEADTGIAASQDYGSYVDRMIEVLRRSPVLHVGGGKTVNLRSIRPPAKTLSLSAEALVMNGNGRSAPSPRSSGSKGDDDKPVAIVFGPESGAVSEKTVYEAAREAHAKSYSHLYVIGFAIQPNARKLVDECEAVIGVPATYVQATPDLMMGDLLKNMRSSQIFSVCGLPEVKLRQASAAELEKLGVEPKAANGGPWYQVELIGLDVFDPGTMEVDHRPGGDVPCWLLDSDYNGLCFKASQVFFPRTAAWNDLKRALKADYDDSVWAHLAGSSSAPFQIGEHCQIAVKVIDDRGNELLVVKQTKEAEK